MFNLETPDMKIIDGGNGGGVLFIFPCLVGCGSCALDLGVGGVVSFVRLVGVAIASVSCSSMEAGWLSG